MSGELVGDEAIVGIETVDRAGSGIRAPHAGHPIGSIAARLHAMETEGCGRRQEYVGRIGIIDGDAENLSDFSGNHRQALRLIDPMLA